MSRAPDSIIFDLGGVLIDWNPRHLYRKLISGSEEMEQFLTHVCPAEWNAEQDSGRTIEEAVAEKVQEFPEYAHLIEAYYPRFDEMIGDSIEATVAILADLRTSGRRLFALTNWSADTFHLSTDQFEFMNWFEDVAVSGFEKLRKPDPRFFQRLLDRNGIEPGSALFIDDIRDNVEAARRLGLSVLQFITAERLRDELVEMGALRPAT